MKFILAFLFLAITTVTNASEITVEQSNETKMELLDGRKHKQQRKNKKRKRMCKQFGRRIYAG